MRQSHKGLEEGIPHIQAMFPWDDIDTKESKEVEPWEMGKTKRIEAQQVPRSSCFSETWASATCLKGHWR